LQVFLGVVFLYSLYFYGNKSEAKMAPLQEECISHFFFSRLSPQTSQSQ
jgi:hypothetical protein